ncbi:hypothetical protein [Paenibacillus marinisediminis]
MKLKHELDRATDIKLKKAVFAGKLATEDDLAHTTIDAPITFADEYNEHLFFNVVCVSPIPIELENAFYYPNRVLRGSTRSIANLQKLRAMIPNYDRLLPIDRKMKLIEVLEDKLILFSLNHSSMHLNIEIIRVEPLLDRDATSYTFIPMPHLTMHQSREDFEQRIWTSQPIPFDMYPNLFSDPEFVFYGNRLYTNLSFKRADIPTTYYVTNPDDVRIMDVTHNFYDRITARLDSHLLVVTDDVLSELRHEMNADGVKMLDWQRTLQLPPNGELVVQNELSASQSGMIDVDHEHHALREFPFHEDEIHLLEQLNYNAQKRGLYYDEIDLYNFHVSVKTNNLTIVGGLSGTGKSQLARLYGETIGLTLGHNMLMIPISPAYREPNDILGYLNPSTGAYHESETGLVSLLLEAEKYPEGLYMVIFDEMNLSQVEHWFSPFISLLELESDKRMLTLYHAGANCSDAAYSSTLHIGDNVIFVGTVNFDETTKDFSDRLLDRANIIIPRKLSFMEVRDRQVQDDTDGDILPYPVNTELMRDIWTVHKHGSLDQLTEQEVLLLDSVHEAIHEHDRQQGISFRVVRAIARYVANIPMDANGKGIIERGVALDLQLAQRVLTKISGSETDIGALVGSYLGSQYETGTLVRLLQSDSAQQISTFKQSIQLLKHKAKELMMHGYIR